MLSCVLQQFTRKRRPQRSLVDVRPLHADVRLRVRAKRAPLKLRVDVTKLHQHPLRSLTEMRHPGTKPLAEQMARLRGCDRIESSDACASVAPQARIRPASRRAGNPSYNISRSQQPYCKTKKAVLIALYARYPPTFLPSFWCLLCTLCASNSAALGNCRNLSLAPTLRWNKGAVISTASSSALASPSSPLAPSTRLPSFYILSRTFPLSATPATHAI